MADYLQNQTFVKLIFNNSSSQLHIRKMFEKLKLHEKLFP